MSFSWTFLQNYFFPFEHVLFSFIEWDSEIFYISVKELTDDVQTEGQFFWFPAHISR